MDYLFTISYLKSTTISAVGLLAIIAAIMAILSVVDVVTWQETGEALWRTSLVLAIIVLLAGVTGLLVDWSRRGR